MKKLPLLQYFYWLLLPISCTAQPHVTNADVKPLFAKSTGKLPALSYGLGSDRLGGAKMGYIDTGIILKITDSAETMYKVQLSQKHSAYINKADVLIDTSVAQKPFYLTSFIKAVGEDSLQQDIVQIAVDDKLPYKSWMQTEPTAIQIQIFGAQSNTNWITQLTSAKEIKNIYYNQVEDDVVQIAIELNHQSHWGYSIAYEGNKLTIKVKRQPSLDIKKLKIAIDAGHGGSNGGANGVKTNIAEKDLTLIYAKQLKRFLEKAGVKNVYMLRTTDTTIEMKDRILMAQHYNPDILLSLHFNSSNNKEVNGASTYYKHIGFKPLSVNILKKMLELPLTEFGNVGSFNFGLNSPTDFVNCLVEIAFLSNDADEKKVMNPKFQTQIITKLYAGIVAWLKGVE